MAATLPTKKATVYDNYLDYNFEDDEVSISLTFLFFTFLNNDIQANAKNYENINDFIK